MPQTPFSCLEIREQAQALAQLPVGVTIIDPKGTILYYNPYCARLVDRRPEYIGKDIRSCHNRPESIEKIDHILAQMKKGDPKEYTYESVRKGKTLMVRISPFQEQGRLKGFIQSIHILKPGKILP